jgi:WD40 repeat protein
MGPSTRLDNLLRAYEAARGRGEPTTPEDLCRDCPDLLDELRRRLGLAGSAAPETTVPLPPSDVGPATRPPDGEDGPPPLEAGQEPVAGYRLVRRLGRGGFGEVWEAEGPGGFRVAFKFVEAAGPAGAVEQQALDIIRNLRHPNLLTVFATWQTGRWLVIGMELADKTLSHCLDEARARGEAGLARRPLVRYAQDTAKVLDFLNKPRHYLGGPGPTGIQHDDVKPQNILLVGEGVKVGDFGLMRLLGRAVGRHAGGMTPEYAAPELFAGRISRWSDQYALAVTWCQLRGGRLPFPGPRILVAMGRLHGGPDLSMLPEEERPVVARALSPDPRQRWPNCRAFVRALAECRADPARAGGTPPPSVRGDPIRFACPRCKHVLVAPPDQGGVEVGCPSCGMRVKMPVPPLAGPAPRGRPAEPQPPLPGAGPTAWRSRPRPLAGRRFSGVALVVAAVGLVAAGLYYSVIVWSPRRDGTELEARVDHRGDWGYAAAPRAAEEARSEERGAAPVPPPGPLDAKSGRGPAEAGKPAKARKEDKAAAPGVRPAPPARAPEPIRPPGPRRVFRPGPGPVLRPTSPALVSSGLGLLGSPHGVSTLAGAPLFALGAHGDSLAPPAVASSAIGLSAAPPGYGPLLAASALPTEAGSVLARASGASPAGQPLPVPVQESPAPGYVPEIVTHREPPPPASAWPGGEWPAYLVAVAAAVVAALFVLVVLRARRRLAARRAPAGPGVRAPEPLPEPGPAPPAAGERPFGTMYRAAIPESRVLTVRPTLGRVRTPQVLHPLGRHDDAAWAVAADPAGRLALSGGLDGAVCLWDIETRTERWRRAAHSGGVSAVFFSADGAHAFSAGLDGTLCAWRLDTGEEARRFGGHAGRVLAAAELGGGLLIASGGEDRTVRLWESATGRLVRLLEGHPGWVTALAASPDGARLLSAGDDGILRLWDAEGRELRRLTGHAGPVRCVAFAPDGRRAASGGEDRTARVWDVEAGRELARLGGHADWVGAVAFAPDGRRVATGGDDEALCLWDADAGAQDGRHEVEQGSVLAVAFTPDGRRVLSGLEDGTVALFDAG